MDKYILISLNEKKSKDLAHVISNPTARKILDHLGEVEKESPINLSEKLDIPLSTVTYSLKHLQKEGLIEKKDFAWSEKGKKVWFYSVAKKMIIIVPKGFDWRESLKKILPVAFIGFMSSVILKLVYPVRDFGAQATQLVAIEADEGVAEMALDSTQDVARDMAVSIFPEYAWVFVLVATLGLIVLMLAIDFWRSKHEKNT